MNMSYLSIIFLDFLAFFSAGFVVFRGTVCKICSYFVVFILKYFMFFDTIINGVIL